MIDSKLESAVSSCTQAAEAKVLLYEGTSPAGSCALWLHKPAKQHSPH